MGSLGMRSCCYFLKEYSRVLVITNTHVQSVGDVVCQFCSHHIALCSAAIQHALLFFTNYCIVLGNELIQARTRIQQQ